MSAYAPTAIEQMTTFTYLDDRGSHLLRLVSLEGSHRKIPFFLGVDICRILGLHPAALSYSKSRFARVDAHAVGLSTSSQTAVVLDKEGLFRLLDKSYAVGSTQVARPFEMWLRGTILPQLETKDIPARIEGVPGNLTCYLDTTAVLLPEPENLPCLLQDGKAHSLDISGSSSLFEHPAFGNLRVITDEQTGEPWFVAKDIAHPLGYSNPQKAVREHCKRVNKTVTLTSQGAQTVSIIPESDVYRLIMRSKLPAAEQFEAWVMEDVLPAIRQHGGYLTPKLTADALIDPDVIINLATQLKQDREKLASIRKEVSSLQTTLALAEAEKAKVSEELAVATPKAILVDEVFARPKHDGSERLFKLQDVVRKLARVNTLAIKRDLERLGYLYKRAGVYRVYSLYRDKLFTEKYDCRNGKTDIYATKEGAALISKLHKDKRLTMKG